MNLPNTLTNESLPAPTPSQMKPIITQTNERDLQVTKRLKYLTPGQNTQQEIQSRDLVKELTLKEQPSSLCIAPAQDQDNEIENLSEESSDEDQDLITELEKIRKEKATKTESIPQKPPPLNPLISEAPMKRHWTQETLFKNQRPIKKPEEEKVFVNDILHQESHRKFMQKHIR